MELELREYSLEEMLNRHSIPDSRLRNKDGEVVLISQVTGTPCADENLEHGDGVQRLAAKLHDVHGDLAGRLRSISSTRLWI